MTSAKGPTAPLAAGIPSDVAPVPEALRQEFADLGLSPYSSRILLALLQLGSVNTLQLAKVAKVPRTSTYQVLEELRDQGLALQVPGDGPAVWTCSGRDKVMDLLDAAAEERLAEHKARTARIRQLMAESFPETPSVALPCVQLLASSAQIRAVFEQLLAEAETEFLMFAHPPYNWVMGNPEPVVLEALARGVQCRVLYEATEWQDPTAGALRAGMDLYQRSGVEVRLVEELPTKLMVVDGNAVLMAMTAPVGADMGFPTTLLVEHPGFAKTQVEAFEQRWAKARPVSPASFADNRLPSDAATPSSSVPQRAPRTGLRPDGRLSSAEAAAYLGIGRTTLHSYVSRGLLHSERQPDGQMNTFDPEELTRFAANRRRRRNRAS